MQRLREQLNQLGRSREDSATRKRLLQQLKDEKPTFRYAIKHFKCQSTRNKCPAQVRVTFKVSPEADIGKRNYGTVVFLFSSQKRT